MILELLLVNHPLDCPICDKGGECDLQDYAMAYGRGASDVADPKQSKPKGVDLGPTIVLDEERCVVCQRCVRFDDIIAAERQLVVKDRGHHDIIATSTGDAYRHNFTGNTTELCPVGALTSKTYRFKSRPWDLNRVQTSCQQCAVGCQQFVDVRYGNVLRTMMVEADDKISDGWLCDRGRYNIGFYDAPERIVQPLYRDPKSGEFVQIGWDDAFMLWAKAINDAKAANKGAGAIGGGRLLNEEAYLLQHVFRSIGVNNLDWRAGRQRVATPVRSGSYEDIEKAAAVIIIGETPEERAPVMWLRVIKAVTKNNAKLIRVASLDREPNVPFVDVSNADEAIRALPEQGNVVVIWDGVDTQLGGALRDTLAARNGIAFIASEQPNARGAEAMGMLPQNGGMDTLAMFDAARRGDVGVLSLFGVNPVRNGIDPAAAREALQATPFVVVSELFMTETAELATLVLPARAAFEKNGTTIDIAGDLVPVNSSLKGPDGTLSDLEMLVGLAQQFDLALPAIEELEQTVLTRTAQHAGAPVTDNVRVEARPAPSVWDGGGTSAHDERIAALRPFDSQPSAAAQDDRSVAKVGAK